MENITKEIERMLKPYKEIQLMSGHLKKIQNQIEASTSLIYESTQQALKAQESLIEPLLNFQKSIENINKIYSSIPEFKNPILKQLDTFKEIGERLKEFQAKTPRYILLIAQHGWYIDLEGELNFPSRIAYEIEQNQIETANQLLIEYYRENLDQIFERLIKRHPNRKEILNQILLSYNNKYYNLLITSVLTQIDGVCYDFTKRKFFIKEKRYLPEVILELEKSSGTFLDIYLSPLQNQTPIMVREKDIKKFPCHLNRHEILHGISVDYGSEINSLKVISLLKYISDLLTDLDQKTLSTTTAHRK